jgi:hypothetical protein
MEHVIRIVQYPRLTVDAIVAPLVFVYRRFCDHLLPSHRNNYHPHLLSNRMLGLFSVLLVAVKLFTVAALALGPAAPAVSSAITSYSVIGITNQSRAQENILPLRENPLLSKAAQAKAEDMLANGYFAHNSPQGKTPWDFINLAGYSYITAGENLAVNFTEAESIGDAWMNSPSHRANILNKNYEEIGVGIATGEYKGQSATFVVQMFGTHTEQKIALSDVPTKVAGTESGSMDASQGAQETMAIRASDAFVIGEEVVVTATITGNPVKVIARYGGRGIMLDYKEDGIWAGSASLKSIMASGNMLTVRAYDMSGQVVQQKLASFAPDFETAFQQALPGQVAGASTRMLGITFNPNEAEYRFYGFFLAGMLSAMALAIGLKRHIQHIGLIANTSFVAILATLLWVT